MQGSSLLLCLSRVTVLLKLHSICIHCSLQVWRLSTSLHSLLVSAISYIYWLVSAGNPKAASHLSLITVHGSRSLVPASERTWGPDIAHSWVAGPGMSLLFHGLCWGRKVWTQFKFKAWSDWHRIWLWTVKSMVLLISPSGQEGPAGLCQSQTVQAVGVGVGANYTASPQTDAGSMSKPFLSSPLLAESHLSVGGGFYAA